MYFFPLRELISGFVFFSITFCLPKLRLDLCFLFSRKLDFFQNSLFPMILMSKPKSFFLIPGLFLLF